MTPERECYPDCPAWEGDHRPGCPNELEALRNENSRLRQLLDEIHRGEATPPRAPKAYDAESTMSEAKRITRFMKNPDGGRALSLYLHGVLISIRPFSEEQQTQANAIAEQIAALGPEGLAIVEPPPLPPETTAPAVRRRWAVGEIVWCTVTGAPGLHKVLAVRPSDGYVKVDGVRSWCPPYNFKATA